MTQLSYAQKPERSNWVHDVGIVITGGYMQDYYSIQAAVEAAKHGDTVLVIKNTYYLNTLNLVKVFFPQEKIKLKINKICRKN